MLTYFDKKNAIWNSISFIGISILNFASFSINFHTFSSSEFGLFILINSIFGIGTTVDFGFGIATVKHISEAKKKNDFELINRIFVTFFWLFLIFAFLIIIIIIFYYLLFLRDNEIFKNVVLKRTDIIFYLLLTSFFFKYINNYLGRVYEGFMEFVLVAKIYLFNSIASTFLMILLFVFNLKIESLAVIYLIMSVILFISLISFALTKIPNLHFKFRYFSLKILKEYSIYGINIQVSYIIYSFIDPIVKFIIGKYINLNMITFYETAKKIIELTNGLIISAQKGLLNKLSEENAIGKLNIFINENLFIYSKMANYYTVLIYGLLNSFFCLLINYWFKSIEIVIIYLIYLLPYSLINFAGCLYSVITVEGKGIKLVIMQSINFVFIISFLLISIILFNSYIGLLGYYFATITTVTILVFLLKRYNNFNIKLFFSRIAFGDVIILNIFVLSELILLYIFSDKYFYLLIFYSALYVIVFIKYLKYFFKVILEKGKNIFQYI